MSEQKAKVVKKDRVHSGRWLTMDDVHWQDRKGIDHQWESVSRVGGVDAAMVIPVCQPSGDLVLIKQFRPPIGNWVLEFPAGLIDEGESAEQCAIRELKEETGYLGKLKKVQGPYTISPGLTDEMLSVVCVEIDESLEENKNPQPAQEGSEDIKIFKLSKSELQELIQNPGELSIDIKCVIWLLGSQED